MADTSNLTNYLKDIAKAIKDKKGITEPILAANFDIEIETMNVGVDTSDATATSEDIAEGRSAYVNGERVVGTLRTVDSGNDYAIGHFEDIDVRDVTGDVYFSKSCPVDGGILYRYDSILKGYVPMWRLANSIGLTSDKIVSGNIILGVEGTAETGGIDTSDATATSMDIASGVSAYVNGEKIEGSLDIFEMNSNTTASGAEYSGSDIVLKIPTDSVMRTGSGVTMNELDLASSLQIDANTIMSGQTVLGVTGYATDDADVTEYDIVENRTAYARGQLIYGTMGDMRGTDTGLPVYGDNVEDDSESSYLRINGRVGVSSTGYPSVAVDDVTATNTEVPYHLVVNALGLTSDTIVEGCTVLGVEGTGKSQSSMNGENSMFWVDHVPALDSITPKGDEPRRAIVCREPDIFRYTAQPTVRIVHFPSTITLESPAEYDEYTEFIGETDDMRTVAMRVSVTPYDNSATIYFEGDAIGIYESNGASIKYITEDGLTYTRNDKECVLDGLYNFVDWTFYSPAPMNGPNGYPDVCSYFVNCLQADEHVISDTFNGIYYYDDNVQHWVKEPLPVTVDECDVKADQLFISMHGLMRGANKTSGSHIKLDDNNIINLTVLNYDYVPINLDGNSSGVYGKVTSFRAEPDGVAVNVDIKTMEYTDVGDLTSVYLHVEFFDERYEILNQSCFVYEYNTNVSELFMEGHNEVIAIRESTYPEIDRDIRCANNYKIYFSTEN